MLKSLHIAINGYLSTHKAVLSIATDGYLQYQLIPPDDLPVRRRRGDAEAIDKDVKRRPNDSRDMLDIIYIFLRCKN